VPQRSRWQLNRLYSLQHVEAVALIRFCRSLYMSLEEVRVLIRGRGTSTSRKLPDRVTPCLDEKDVPRLMRGSMNCAAQHQLRNLRGLCPQSDEVENPVAILVELTRSARSNKAQI